MSGADCSGLIEKTTAALSSENLQQLFLSTQQNNIELCVIYGVKRWGNMIFKYTIFMILRIMNLSLSKSEKSTIKENNRNWTYIMGIVLIHFPHLVVCIWLDQKRLLSTNQFL